jgi:hypothetical protein
MIVKYRRADNGAVLMEDRMAELTSYPLPEHGDLVRVCCDWWRVAYRAMDADATCQDVDVLLHPADPPVGMG